MKSTRTLGLIVTIVCGVGLPGLLRAAAAPAAASTEQAATVAGHLQEAVAKGDTAGADAEFDIDAFLDRTTAGVSSTPQYDQGFRSGVKEGSALLGQIVRAANGGSYRLLRIRQVSGQTRALFRMLPKDGGLNYHDWVLGTDAQGAPKFVDIYVAVTGELTSQTLRRVYLMGAVQSKPTLLQRLTGTEKDLAANLDTMKQITADVQSGKDKEALDAYKTLPKSLQENKTFMMMRLAAAQHRQEQDPQEYQNVMADFQRLFPGDPGLDLTCLDSVITARKFPEAFASIDRLEAFTGGDAYLVFLRANLYLLRGEAADLGQAKQLYRRAITAEPGLTDPYWGMVTLTLKAKEFDQTAAMLDEIQKNLGIHFKDLETVPEYAEFTKSDAYRKWKAAHAQ